MISNIQNISRYNSWVWVVHSISRQYVGIAPGYKKMEKAKEQHQGFQRGPPPTCTPPVKLAEWLEQTKLESGTDLVPSKDAICHMIGDVVVFLCSLVLCLLTIFSASVLFSVVYVSHGVTDGIADWITLAWHEKSERDISFLLVQILARDHGCLASRIKRSLITPFSFIFLSPYV